MNIHCRLSSIILKHLGIYRYKYIKILYYRYRFAPKGRGVAGLQLRPQIKI